jgi:hypothetical protein
MKDNGTGYRFLPYASDFTLLKKWRATGATMLYVISGLSILIPLARQFAGVQWVDWTKAGLEFVNYILIIAYFATNVVSEVFLYPAAARQRRLNFIDNSLGSRFLGEDSRGYFSNDRIGPGPYKMAVNCFENCFFTFRIAKSMEKGIVIRNALFAFVFLTFAYVGIRNNAVGLPILQIFLSSLFVAALIHHLQFVSKLAVLLDKFKMFFMETMADTSKKAGLQYPIVLLLEYETTLAYNKAPTSDRLYMKIKDQLSEEWDELKKYYKIEETT